MEKGNQSRREKHQDLANHNFTSKKEDIDQKSEFSPCHANSDKTTNLTHDEASPQLIPGRQRRKLFNGTLKLSRNRWMSMGHEKPTRKNRVLKSEKSMDDAELLEVKQGSSLYCGGPSRPKESVELDQGTDLDTLPEEFSLDSFNDTQRRGSICEELEKEIVEGGISLHKMRKAMVIQETLKDRFMM